MRFLPLLVFCFFKMLYRWGYAALKGLELYWNPPYWLLIPAEYSLPNCNDYCYILLFLPWLTPIELLGLVGPDFPLLRGVITFFVKFSMGLTESMNSLRFSFASASKSILLMIAIKRLSVGMTPHLTRNLFKLI